MEGESKAHALRDERYTGMNIFGKRVRDEIGKNHTVRNGRDKWIEVENTHSGIVTREEFDRAQEQMRKFVEHPYSPTGNLFCKKVRCGGMRAHHGQEQGKEAVLFLQDTACDGCIRLPRGAGAGR